MSTALKLTCLGLSATIGCVVAGLAPYPAAAVLGGTNLAAVSVNRSITGECWGACQVHWICERDSGLCVPPPCGGECHIDEICENDRCVVRRREKPASSADFDSGVPFAEVDAGG